MTTNVLSVELSSGETLDVRDFVVEEGISQLFDLRLVARAPSVDVDFEAAIGQPARFEIKRTSPVDGDTRYWSGVCARAGQIGVEEDGLSTYAIRIVPTMWLLTQRRNYRVFQDKSELDIALEILGEWGIQPVQELDAESYGKRRMRVQYAESDFDFVNRLLEDIGVAYCFEQVGGSTVLVLVDTPSRKSPRAPVRFVDKPNDRIAFEYVTEVQTHREIRPGRYTQSDVDFRKALNYPLAASSSLGNAIESKLERYHHNYGSFLWKGQGADTPVADDRGAARTNEREGGKQVDKRLEAQRVDARTVTFRTVAHDLRPGKVFTVASHPRADMGAPLLVVSTRWSGTAAGEWIHTCEARYTDVAYRPPLRTPKPRTHGVESATVTGPAGEEIHCDEFGRVRVHFHWDREGTYDETSSCWIPVSQAWAGAGFGAVSLPRVGQEVLVDFLGADPDRPIVMGRVFTTTMPPPYELPKFKMVSGQRSESYPRPKSGGAQARMGGGPAAMAAPLPTPAAPAGGGPPLVALGGDEPGTGVDPATGDAPTALPGLRGGPQASLEDLNMTVEQLKSQGPDLMDHNRSANALVHDDTAGAERMYIQAQRNMYETVKADLIGSVGGNRGFTILGNDTTRVQFYQITEVGMDRRIAVGGKQSHYVIDDASVQCQANMTTVTPNGSQVHLAKQGIMLQVGSAGPSTIMMLPDAIVIDAKEVYINPGATFMSALVDGQSPQDAKAAQEQRDADAAAQIEANNRRIEQLQQESWPARNQAYTSQREAEGYRDLAARDPQYQDDYEFVQSVAAQDQAVVDGYDQQIADLRAQNAALEGGS